MIPTCKVTMVGHTDSQSVRIPHILGMLCWLLLAFSNPASGISKLTMPALDEQDLPFYLSKSTPPDNPELYLFSSLSLISRRRGSATFEISDTPTRGLTPLLGLTIPPPPDASLQSEFFDVTIWGQLGNLFQTHVGLLAIEREILALFKELEELNARYLALLGEQMGGRSEADRPLTLDRRNYLQQRSDTGASQRGGGERSGQTTTNSGANQDLRRLIQQHEQGSQAEFLRPQLAAGVQASRAPVLEANAAAAAAAMHAAETKQDPEVTGGVPEGRLFHLFKLLKLTIRYCFENKIEAIIYLWVLILLSVSIKAMFKRS